MIVLITFQLVCFLTFTFGHPIPFTISKVQTHCTETQFPCFDVGMTCIPFRHRCDGQIQCPSTGADEYHCDNKNISFQSNLKISHLNFNSFFVNIYSTEQLLMCIIVITFLFFIHKT